MGTTSSSQGGGEETGSEVLLNVGRYEHMNGDTYIEQVHANDGTQPKDYRELYRWVRSKLQHAGGETGGVPVTPYKYRGKTGHILPDMKMFTNCGDDQVFQRLHSFWRNLQCLAVAAIVLPDNLHGLFVLQLIRVDPMSYEASLCLYVLDPRPTLTTGEKIDNLKRVLGTTLRGSMSTVHGRFCNETAIRDLNMSDTFRDIRNTACNEGQIEFGRTVYPKQRAATTERRPPTTKPYAPQFSSRPRK